MSSGGSHKTLKKLCVELTDAESDIVGYVRMHVLSWLPILQDPTHPFKPCLR